MLIPATLAFVIDAPQDTLDFVCARLKSRIDTQFIYKSGERGYH